MIGGRLFNPQPFLAGWAAPAPCPLQSTAGGDARQGAPGSVGKPSLERARRSRLLCMHRPRIHLARRGGTVLSSAISYESPPASVRDFRPPGSGAGVRRRMPAGVFLLSSRRPGGQPRNARPVRPAAPGTGGGREPLHPHPADRQPPAERQRKGKAGPVPHHLRGRKPRGSLQRLLPGHRGRRLPGHAGRARWRCSTTSEYCATTRT